MGGLESLVAAWSSSWRFVWGFHQTGGPTDRSPALCRVAPPPGGPPIILDEPEGGGGRAGDAPGDAGDAPGDAGFGGYGGYGGGGGGPVAAYAGRASHHSGGAGGSGGGRNVRGRGGGMRARAAAGAGAFAAGGPGALRLQPACPSPVARAWPRALRAVLSACASPPRVARGARLAAPHLPFA